MEPRALDMLSRYISHIPTPTARPYKVLLEHSPVGVLTIVSPMLTRYIIQQRWRSRDYEMYYPCYLALYRNVNHPE